ncbi:glycosyltransferase family 39 protein [bacterium]|nr:glycosyltransferase family 39 protein [bacterium]
MMQDQARDSYYAMRIAQGLEFPLFGPWMSIDFNTRGSPVYYYLVALGCFIGGTPLAAVIEMNILWLVTLAVTGIALRRLFGGQAALFTVIFLLVCPELLHLTDTIWSPHLLVALSLLTFSFSLLFANSGSVRLWYAFILTGVLCTHMHPMAFLAPLAFLPVVSLQKVAAKHKITGSALGVALAIPLSIGILTEKYTSLTVLCLVIYVGVGPMIALGHFLVRRFHHAVFALHDRLAIPMWGLVLGSSLYSIAKFYPNPLRPTLWLIAFFALWNLFRRGQTDKTSCDLARCIELPVLIVSTLPFIPMLAANLQLGAELRPHYSIYALPIAALYIGLRLFQVLREGSIQLASVRIAGLNRAIIVGAIVLLGFGHIYNHVILVGNPYIFTFGGAKTLVRALLERFGDDERVFDGRVFVYRKETGQEDENCPFYTYYHFCKDHYKRPTDNTDREVYVLIINRWEAQRREYPNCFFSSPKLSAFEFRSMSGFGEFVDGLGLRADFDSRDIWQAPFYVGGYTPEEWIRIALANDRN